MHLYRIVLGLLLLTASAASEPTPVPPAPTPADGTAAIDAMVEQKAWIWHWARDGGQQLVTHSVYEYALILCEASRELDRLPALLKAGAALQDRDPDSGTYGNFRWYARDSNVVDPNAVEFCMRNAMPLWILHREKLSAEDQAVLRETLDIAAQGCLNHIVPRGYTNIGFMRSLNLILLGEALDQPATAEAGYKFLDEVIGFIQEYGIQEYVSPTYHGVTFGCLYLLHRFAGTDRVRQQAAAMLDLFWTDIALNWHPRNEKVTGAFSRTYSYLHSRGGIYGRLACSGWIDGECGSLDHLYARWQPQERHWQLAHQLPRLVRQRWGHRPEMTRTSYLCEDIVLSASGAPYSRMDQPLTVDFVSRPGLPRAYFIADAREDPYGMKEIPTGGHQKAEHVAPLWTAAQRQTDALGVALYRGNLWDQKTETLQSHFVLPKEVDGLWIGDESIDLARTEPWELHVGVNQPITVRCDTAALGLRVIHAATASGQDAAIRLIFDGNEHGVVRLSILHAAPDEHAAEVHPLTGAVCWLRAGSQLATQADFATWRDAFTAVAARIHADSEALNVIVPGDTGPVAIKVALPRFQVRQLTPQPTQTVLECNGNDVASSIFAGLSK